MMEVHDAAEILLKAVHNDLHGRLEWSKFIEERTLGLNDSAAAELRGTYSRALIVLIDEGLCHKIADTDIIELAQKGIAAKGDYKKFLRKKNTTVLLEKLRRIAPILSFIVVLISFIITMLKKHNAKQAAARPHTVHVREAHSSGRK